MEIFRKTMDFFQKNSHVFRISWEKIEGTREEKTKIKRKKKYTQRYSRQKQKVFTAKTKGIHGRNKKDSTAETNPQQQKQIHGKNKKDSTQNRKERRAIRA